MELDQQTTDELRGGADWHRYQKKPRGPYTYEERMGSMQTFRRIGRSMRWTPEFASDDAMLRSVIVHAAVNYCFRNQPPAGIVDSLSYWDARTKARTAVYEAAQQWAAIQEYLAAQAACGGYMALHTAIAYRAWRLHWPDEEIAASLAMQYATVGRVLRKLIRIAAELGYPTYPQKYRRKDVVSDDEIVNAWHEGLTTEAIAKKLNCSPTRVRFLLKKLGLFTYRRYPLQFKNARAKADDIVKLWNEGLGTVQIATKLGTCSALVVRVLKKLGLYQLRCNSVTGMAAVKHWIKS